MTLLQTLNNYQEFTPTTAIYPDANTGKDRELLYLSLGLMGERQEWIESGADKKEAGDVIWYISQICNAYNLSLYDLFVRTLITYDRVNLPEHLKKMLRDGKDIKPALLQKIDNVILEMKGLIDLNTDLVEIIKLNTEKLTSRKTRNKLKGDGDER